MKSWRSILSAIIWAHLSSSAALAQGNGSVLGTVVDETGAPVAGAKVNATPLNGRPMVTLIRFVETDREGNFLIDRLDWGIYGVFAMKEEAGYPNLRASLYSNDVFPRVVIAPSSPVAKILIQLGPRAGTITGSITNALNGAPLNAGIKLTRARAPGKWLSTSVPPNYRILLPSSTDVLLEVSAPGFRTWTPPNPFRLQPGAELRLDIALEPSHDPSLHPSRFLVPDGYTGWLLLEYDVKDAKPAPVEAAMEIFKFPSSGALNTSSPGPQWGAENEYLYYSRDGSLHEIPTDYRNGKGMIWGQYQGTRNGRLAQFGFFVGTEEQYKKYEIRKTHPGPILSPQ